MASNELIEKVALAIAKEHERIGRNYGSMAQAAISTILAALQETTEDVLKAGHEAIYEGYYDASMDFALHPAWQAMLNASPLGEQSE